jgi:hypothetical protein
MRIPHPKIGKNHSSVSKLVLNYARYSGKHPRIECDLTVCSHVWFCGGLLHSVIQILVLPGSAYCRRKFGLFRQSISCLNVRRYNKSEVVGYIQLLQTRSTMVSCLTYS